MEELQKKALDNYRQSNPWPENDKWHEQTYVIINDKVTEWINENIHEGSICLNIGSGTTRYETKGHIISMDIVEKYVSDDECAIVGSIEKIPLPDKSVDYIICVGSVLNYADIILSISEISRILKKGGKLLLEFERSNSAEFLLTKMHKKKTFHQKYHYNNQEHILWMYEEDFVINLLKNSNLITTSQYRFHILSSLLNRFNLDMHKVAWLSKFDNQFQSISKNLAHNTILYLEKSK